MRCRTNNAGASTKAAEPSTECRQLLAASPVDVLALADLGLRLGAEARLDQALHCQRAALCLLPGNAKLYANLANLLAQLGRADAESLHRRSLQLDARAAITWSNLGAFLALQGRELEGEACLRRALQLQPGYARARVNLAYLLLRQGRLREGWLQHEARYEPIMPDRASLPPQLPFPQWRGEDLTGKSLLIWPEQGLGDEIQFCRYVTRLKARGASRITWVCKAPLLRLLQTLVDVDAVLSFEQAQAGVADHDYWSFPLSLPLYCGTLPGQVPAPIPYLRAAAPDRGDWWDDRPAGTLRVGLVWRGNPKNPQDGDRSLSELSLLEALWSLPGITWVSLQRGDDEARLPAALPILRWGRHMQDFADAAAMLAQIDLLISVDTAIAHLAGAMGRACWLLLPAHMTDWRWGASGEDSAWYPQHRLFRQTQRGHWRPVMDRVRRALLALTQDRGAASEQP